MTPERHQELFSHIYLHLKKQGPARAPGGNCQYRTAQNKTCAVGCLIEDDEYSTWLEGNSISTIIDLYERFAQDVPKIFHEAARDDALAKFLTLMQRWHDGYLYEGDPEGKWEKLMCAYARENGLTVPNA